MIHKLSYHSQWPSETITLGCEDHSVPEPDLSHPPCKNWIVKLKAGTAGLQTQKPICYPHPPYNAALTNCKIKQWTWKHRRNKHENGTAMIGYLWVEWLTTRKNQIRGICVNILRNSDDGKT